MAVADGPLGRNVPGCVCGGTSVLGGTKRERGHCIVICLNCHAGFEHRSCTLQG